MSSPYLHRRLRTLDEAVEDRLLKDLSLRHKKNHLASKSASLKQADNVYRLGPRLTTKIGTES
ncbi:MAG: hypothetical protein ISR50_02980 [Alphaproteobacteria bacterium]|nr:hypothetical protein [Alphaproteobacteria bacterium]MBL6951568.1 hypothetical protein [Alphaproteobacteria bacterium]